MSILHLLGDKQSVISKVHTLLKPGGVFVSSTACLGDFMPWIRYLTPVARVLGLIPRVEVFTEHELTRSITAAGFTIDYKWHPAPKKAVFIVANKSLGEMP